MFLSFESSNARKNSLEEGNQDPGEPGVGKGRGGGFFSFKQGGGTDSGWHSDKLVQHKKNKIKILNDVCIFMCEYV